MATKRHEEASEQDRDGEEKGLALYFCDLHTPNFPWFSLSLSGAELTIWQLFVKE